ncbi:class I SAM-dependent methyltransferase [Streptomyces sp. SJL17-4]|uniref:class I SAM-dependent methyltransferase n=1 Tax=Streptomyces sp. SJL17-4 TaxID=2967224 RepID=UPI0030D12EBE
MREQDAGAWDVWGAARPGRKERNAAGASTWFNWTQWPDHGPDEKVLGDVSGARVLDLGCGNGGNLAHLVALGAEATGVDISPVQVAKAREHRLHLDVRQQTAEEFLAAGTHEFTAPTRSSAPPYSGTPQVPSPLPSSSRPADDAARGDRNSAAGVTYLQERGRP